MERLIFHVDVNSAFLSWEAARRVAAGEADLRLSRLVTQPDAPGSSCGGGVTPMAGPGTLF